MFWTNWNEQRPSLMRSTLAGKNMRIIVGSDILTPNGLTVDHKAEKLYFSDGSLGKIERCDYDGSGRHVSGETKTLLFFTFSKLFFNQMNLFIEKSLYMRSSLRMTHCFASMLDLRMQQAV